MPKKTSSKPGNQAPLNQKRDVRTAAKVIEELTKFEHQFKRHMTTMIISAFGLVAGLMWTDAIREAVVTLLPPQDALFYKVMVAVLVTVIVVLVTVIFSSKK